MSDRLRQLLTDYFRPLELHVKDESDLHMGHSGAGNGHYNVLIISKSFEGQSLLKRHRMIHRLLHDHHYSFHALGLKTLTPEEVKANMNSAKKTGPSIPAHVRSL